jgi:hypothetical protein
VCGEEPAIPYNNNNNNNNNNDNDDDDEVYKMSRSASNFAGS